MLHIAIYRRFFLLINRSSLYIKVANPFLCLLQVFPQICHLSFLMLFLNVEFSTICVLKSMLFLRGFLHSI